MKSEITIPTKVCADLKFPLLAKSKTNGDVIMFTSLKGGVVLQSRGSYPIGYCPHAEHWVSASDASHWEILPPGTRVVLEF